VSGAVGSSACSAQDTCAFTTGVAAATAAAGSSNPDMGMVGVFMVTDANGNMPGHTMPFRLKGHGALTFSFPRRPGETAGAGVGGP
jgi:hypothetical protein